MKRLSFIALAFLLLATPIVAQETTGNVEGRVTAEGGDTLPGVTVTVVSSGTGAERMTMTDADGRFMFNALHIGSYVVKTELDGMFLMLTRHSRTGRVGGHQTTGINRRSPVTAITGGTESYIVLVAADAVSLIVVPQVAHP